MLGEPPILSARGGMADHDDLAQALGRWHVASALSDATFAAARAKVVACALNCDMPADCADVVAWAERRVATYRRTVAHGVAAYMVASSLTETARSGKNQKAA